MEGEAARDCDGRRGIPPGERRRGCDAWQGTARGWGRWVWGSGWESGGWEFGSWDGRLGVDGNKKPRSSFIWRCNWTHMSADLRVCGFGYQILKSVSKYPLGLKLYPRRCPRVQIQTRIRAQRVRYPRICGYFVPVAILIYNQDIFVTSVR